MNRNGESWRTKAACRNHPVLHPDAWFEVINNVPHELGIEALAVCRYVCPVVNECYSSMAPLKPRETIAGGGWWDGNARWHIEVGTLILDSRRAAAYIGVRIATVQEWVREGVILPCGKRGGKHQFTLDEVRRVQRIKHLPHGTPEQRNAHVIRGERPCLKCQFTTLEMERMAC